MNVIEQLMTMDDYEQHVSIACVICIVLLALHLATRAGTKHSDHPKKSSQS